MILFDPPYNFRAETSPPFHDIKENTFHLLDHQQGLRKLSPSFLLSVVHRKCLPPHYHIVLKCDWSIVALYSTGGLQTEARPLVPSLQTSFYRRYRLNNNKLLAPSLMPLLICFACSDESAVVCKVKNLACQECFCLCCCLPIPPVQTWQVTPNN